MAGGATRWLEVRPKLEVRSMGLVGPLLTVGATAYLLSIKQWVVVHTIKLGFRLEVRRRERCEEIGPPVTVGSTSCLLNIKQWEVFHTVTLGRISRYHLRGLWRCRNPCRESRPVIVQEKILVNIDCRKSLERSAVESLREGQFPIVQELSLVIIAYRDYYQSLQNELSEVVVVVFSLLLLASKCAAEINFRSQVWPVRRISTTENAGPVTGS